MLKHILELRALYIRTHNHESPKILYIDKASFAKLRMDLHVGSSFRLDVHEDSLKFMGAEIMQVIPYLQGTVHVTFH